MGRYSSEDVAQIIKGYRLLDSKGELTSLLRNISHCEKCVLDYPDRRDRPLNALVRPIPLSNLPTKENIRKYSIRIKRDDTFLRNLFQHSSKPDKVINKLGSAKFAIGLLPWLDRCMLFRRRKKTRLMIIGIDYKHFPLFCKNPKEHSFPLDDYREQSNTWGQTWKNFWKNLLGRPYNDDRVNTFIKENGVFLTNSMLCFGGDNDPGKHFYGYLECCRNHIKELIRIVQPEIVVSFGNLGCRNVASILLEQNRNNQTLQSLSRLKNSLKKEMKSIITHFGRKKGIELKYNSLAVTFWPLYQPAWSHICNYKGDYDVLRGLIGVKTRI